MINIMSIWVVNDLFNQYPALLQPYRNQSIDLQLQINRLVSMCNYGLIWVNTKYYNFDNLILLYALQAFTETFYCEWIDEYIFLFRKEPLS